MKPIFDEIRASDLANWADRAESERLLPSLVLQLVLASQAELRSCRFLTHEQTNASGWDGVVDAAKESLYVPAGVSGWELSKRSDVVDKALEDISTRSQAAGEVKPADSTFVAVTLRLWPKKQLPDRSFQDSGEHKSAWAEEQRRAFGWKCVRVVDAVDLAAWIAQVPGVGIWLAHVMGGSVKGVRSLLVHWDHLATLRPSLTPEIFLAGRKGFMDALDGWIAGSACPIEVRTSAFEDLRDAIAAWWARRVTQGSLSRLSPVAVSSSEAWNHLISTVSPLLLLADEGLELTAEQISAATARGHFVIHRTSAVRSRELGTTLAQLNRDALSEELRKIGMDNHEAWRVAGDIAGSGVALKRVLLGHSAEPPWAKPACGPDVAPIVLIGAWDAKSEGDRERVAAVFGRAYIEVEKLLMPLADTNDPLVRCSESKWRVVAREDAWRWLSPYLKPDHFTRFKAAAIAVLAELNPRYDLPEEQRLYANIYGAVPRHSHRLRRATGETLCLLSLRTSESGAETDTPSVARFVVSEVFRNSADWRLWASLDYALVFIAEAAPDVFLNALEDDLKREAPATVALLTAGGKNAFAEHPHVEVMWALEALLWNRQWVMRAFAALARLAARDPGGNMNPRPLGVLRGAFLAWMPQCCLDVSERCRALDRIMEVEPVIGWQLFLALLPKKLDSSSPIHRPSYGLANSSAEKGATVAEYWQQVTHVARGLAEAAADKTEKWEKIIEEIDVLPPDVLDVVLAQVRELGQKLGEAERARLWEALRREADKHRYFVDAKWRMSDDRRAKVEELVAALQPTDPVLRNTWLFSRRDAFLPGTNSNTPYEEQERLKDEACVVAMREIHAARGMSGIRDLLGRINDFEGRRVGWLAAKEVVVSADAEILPSWLESNDKAVVAFAVGYANARFYADGWDWLLSCTPARWKPETFGELATIFPFRQEHWDKVQSLGRDFANAFWCRVGAWVHEATPVEVERAAQELISRGRAFEALQCVHSARFRKIPVAADTLIAVVAAAKVRLAEMAGNSVKPEPGERFDVCHFVDVFEALQKCLTLTSEQRAKVEEFEWFFLPILEDHGQPVLLMEHVEREPGFFVEVLEAARFWPDDLSVDQRQQPTEDQKTMKRIAHMLLENLTRLPGIDAAGNLDAEKFLAWVKEVRRLAAAKGYRKSCEDRLGTMLLHSPVDGAGYWPCSTVCRLLSEDATEEMRHALQIAIFNNQGWPGPLGHDHMMSAFTDRQQAVEKLSVFAGQLQLEFPIVAELLRAIAKEEERFCQRRLNDDE